MNVRTPAQKRMDKIAVILFCLACVVTAVYVYRREAAGPIKQAYPEITATRTTRDGAPVNEWPVNGRMTVYHNGKDSGMTLDEYKKWQTNKDADSARAINQALLIGGGIAVAGLCVAVSIFIARRKS